MDQAFIDEMKKKLLEEQALLKDELQSMSSADPHDHASGSRIATFPNYGDDTLGENTNAPTEVSQYIENMDATERLSRRQQEVLAALQRIQEEKYGLCVTCGMQINEERLVANPSAAQCIDCAKTHTV